jgi:hydroxyacylglutathione hydrolase
MRVVVESAALVLAMEPVGPFAMNQYLLGCRSTGQAAIIDAGGDPAASIALARRFQLSITAVLQTHAHIDHVLGLPETRRQLPDAPIALHPDELPLYEGVAMQARMFGLRAEPLPPVDRWIVANERMAVGALSLQCLLTPGHSPGHICFWLQDHALLIAGDLLFAGSVGRTDLPGADPAVMVQSLRAIMELPDETRVFPGHMRDTTIGHERRRNPFVLDALAS